MVLTLWLIGGEIPSVGERIVEISPHVMAWQQKIYFAPRDKECLGMLNLYVDCRGYAG